METKLRIGTKVRIISTLKKRYLNKTGKVIDKRTNWIGTGFNYLIEIPEIERPIWQSRDDLEVLNAIERAKRSHTKHQKEGNMLSECLKTRKNEGGKGR